MSTEMYLKHEAETSTARRALISRLGRDDVRRLTVTDILWGEVKDQAQKRANQTGKPWVAWRTEMQAGIVALVKEWPSNRALYTARQVFRRTKTVQN